MFPDVSDISETAATREVMRWFILKEVMIDWFFYLPEWRVTLKDMDKWVTRIKQQETHGCIVSIVATDALVLKHQAISILSAVLI